MNEYLEKFNELQEENTFRGQQWFGKRRELVEEYSWAVPNEDVLIYLSEFEHLIEAGAGNGYWAHLIEERGVDVQAVDIEPAYETYTRVESGNVLSDYDIRDNPVLMVWPPCDNDMAYDVVRSKPSHVLYVGEERGGCTATDEFFDELETYYGLVAKVELPSYVGIHDDFYHYVRKL